MLIFWCFLLFQLFVAGEANPLQRIINGKLAEEGEFPYVVQVEKEKLNDDIYLYDCSGSIIANNWVLTATHCTENAEWVSIYYGSTHFQENPTKKLLAKDHVFAHPEYDGDSANDIALIRTEWVEFTDRIQSIPLAPKPRNGYNDYVGQWATVAGWGRINKNGTKSNRLNWTWLQVIDESECRNEYGSNLEGIFCARTSPEQSTCRGDSGAPLVLHGQNKQIGVLSFGSGCDLGETKGFADVSKYLDWIYNVSGVKP